MSAGSKASRPTRVMGGLGVLAHVEANMPLDTTSLDLDTLLDREWLAVNHIGGFACSTVVGLNTRKYHGLLVAALAPPVRRFVLLSRLEEVVISKGWLYPL